MEASETLRNEFDAPWKAALEAFFEPFLKFCFPKVHALIDWRVKPVFLDTELQQIAPEHNQGSRAVDKLVRVRLLDGNEECLYIHIEVQAQPERDFAQRIWIYYYRIWDKYSQRLVSLAVLADGQPGWRPNTFHQELAGCVQHFEFPVFKIIECMDAAAQYEQTGNPFALLVAAHQVALATRHDAAGRCQGRFQIVRYLYRHGLDRKLVVDLLRLIRWLTWLPEEWELKFKEKLHTFERVERVMSIDTLLLPSEEAALAKGRQEGHQEGLLEEARWAVLEVLRVRFGEPSAAAQAKVLAIADPVQLRHLHRAAITAPSLEAFEANL